MNKKLIAALFIAFIICMPYSLIKAVFQLCYDKVSGLFSGSDTVKDLAGA